MHGKKKLSQSNSHFGLFLLILVGVILFVLRITIHDYNHISTADTTSNITVLLHGIGKGGDNANPMAAGNLLPLHPSKTITIAVFDNTDKQLTSVQGSIAYDTASQSFKGTINLTGINPGSYIIKAKVDGYLRRQFPGIQIVATNQPITLPTISLIAGDTTSDNKIDITDYNALISCFGSKFQTCNNPLTDLTDDGKVDGIDYNLFVRELSVQAGQPDSNTIPNPTGISGTPTIPPIPTFIPGKLTDMQVESSYPLYQILWSTPSNYYKNLTPDGASQINYDWEQGKRTDWFIELQRDGMYDVMAGIQGHDTKAIDAGLKMFGWGFAHQGSDGSFPGTGDAFHSTSFFVYAVSRSLLSLKQSEYASQYNDTITKYSDSIHKAALWMIQPDILAAGKNNNNPFTHRRYAVANALGFTGKLTNDPKLIAEADKSITEGLALQTADGVNPEAGGYDSSYQAVGLLFASWWYTYFNTDSLAPRVHDMLEKGFAWEESRVLTTGEVSTTGNTRTGGQETGRGGVVKGVNYREVVWSFAYWGIVTKNQHWVDTAIKIAKFKKML